MIDQSWSLYIMNDFKPFSLFIKNINDGLTCFTVFYNTFTIHLM